MSEQHAPAAIPLELERVKSISLIIVALEQSDVGFPPMADDLSARETANWDDHCCEWVGVECGV